MLPYVAGEMVHQLRALDTLAEDPSLLISTHIGKHTTTCNSSFWRSNSLLCPLMHEGTLLHVLTHINIYIVKNKINSFCKLFYVVNNTQDQKLSLVKHTMSMNSKFLTMMGSESLTQVTLF